MARLLGVCCLDAAAIVVLLLYFGLTPEAKYIGANPNNLSHPELRCSIEGSNSTPGEDLTFRCLVHPTTVIRYCEMRTPWSSSPILVEDGTNTLIGSDVVDELIWIDPSSTSTTPPTTTPWVPKPRTYRTTTTSTTSTTSTSTSTPPSSTTGHPTTTSGVNRTRRETRGRFYGWSSRLDYVGKGFSNGDCSTAIRRVSLEDAGIWRVTVGIEEQMVELAARMEVVLHEATAPPLKTNVEVPEDWAWAILTCHTTDHSPLRFCRFQRADGSPLVSDDADVGPGLNLEAGVGHGRFQYHGNGMSTGDCGLTLTSVLDSDAGDWLCVVGVSGEEGQQRAQLTLRPPPPNLPGGLSLGAMMGIGLVGAFVLFVIVHEVIERRVTWREKRAVRKRNEKASKESLSAMQNGSTPGKF
ncbi:uncharacterized protein LOC124154438 [Ischnura elegans]|uniref:uncharacterized protein LOC124154438 n=1 Tax=Ischnura elegans TaxID=197161 RepID=UPI001ED8AD42|nr:uncharacterized protein LOC124154438 [Ischnura elegans]